MNVTKVGMDRAGDKVIFDGSQYHEDEGPSGEEVIVPSWSLETILFFLSPEFGVALRIF